MKRYLFTGFLLALGSFGAIAPAANAAGSTRTFNVPFTGVAAALCTFNTPIDLMTPGILAPSNDGKVLDSSTLPLGSGTVTVTCNTDYKASVGQPVQQGIIAGGGENLDTLTSSIESVLNKGVTLQAVDAATANLSPGLNVIAVDMTASKSDGTAIQAGAYSFEVPVTITCD